jgi:hypothetical protein
MIVTFIEEAHDGQPAKFLQTDCELRLPQRGDYVNATDGVIAVAGWVAGVDLNYGLLPRWDSSLSVKVFLTQEQGADRSNFDNLSGVAQNPVAQPSVIIPSQD